MSSAALSVLFSSSLIGTGEGSCLSVVDVVLTNLLSNSTKLLDKVLWSSGMSVSVRNVSTSLIGRDMQILRDAKLNSERQRTGRSSILRNTQQQLEHIGQGMLKRSWLRTVSTMRLERVELRDFLVKFVDLMKRFTLITLVMSLKIGTTFAGYALCAMKLNMVSAA